MLAFGPFGELSEFNFGWLFCKNGSFANFGRSFISTNGGGYDRTNDLLERGAIVRGDPFCKFQKSRGDQWFWIDEAGEVTEIEFGLRCFLDAEDSPRSVAVPKGDADAAAGEDFKVIRNSVIKDELGRTVDEYACSEWHRRIMDAECTTSNAEDARACSSR